MQVADAGEDNGAEVSVVYVGAGQVKVKELVQMQVKELVQVQVKELVQEQVH